MKMTEHWAIHCTALYSGTMSVLFSTRSQCKAQNWIVWPLYGYSVSINTPTPSPTYTHILMKDLMSIYMYFFMHPFLENMSSNSMDYITSMDLRTLETICII